MKKCQNNHRSYKDRKSILRGKGINSKDLENIHEKYFNSSWFGYKTKINPHITDFKWH